MTATKTTALEMTALNALVEARLRIADLERERDAALAQNRKLRGAEGRIADLCILVNKLAHALHLVQVSKQHGTPYPSFIAGEALCAARAIGWDVIDAPES